MDDVRLNKDILEGVYNVYIKKGSSDQHKLHV